MYYELLTWPALPDSFHYELLEHVKTANNIRKGVTDRGAGYYFHYKLPVHIEQWCRDHLPIDENFSINIQSFSNITHLPRHVDNPRTNNIIYLLTDPGPITRWFRNGEVVDQTTFDKHNWYKIKVDCVHDVINLYGPRHSISIFQEVPVVNRRNKKLGIKR